MASKQIQCEMCFNENAVGHCKTCGDIGEICVDIHKKGKLFQTHTVVLYEAVKMHEDGGVKPKFFMKDITEDRCKQHPTERAIFLCNVHESMICGRCLHSEHIPCVKEVVDLLQEGITINCEKVNTMKSVLMEVKHEIRLLKNEAEQSKDNYKKTADKCVQECMELGNKIKRRVDELTSGLRDGITDKHYENLTIHSHITKLCDEKTKWCDDEESKIDNFVDNNLAGHLYLMGRHFEKEASDARSHLKEIKHKHTFKGFDFKENNVILKCLFEDLKEVCEQQDEVTGSDDGNANDVFASLPKINKTRRELTVLLNQAKHESDISEKTRKQFEQELLKAKQDIDKSENKRKQFEQDLLKAKQDIENYKKTQKELRDELKRVKQDLSEKERAVVTAQLSSLKDNIKWTQPTGTVDVKIRRRFLVSSI
ncbi:uncharacterized protein LOC128241749 isoform X2 [Mya arenaria]|uniref:uncharacterized protein LOC128241749 isoform X2 n=1 Tax=Mya arenaria TaxID=6604 RepID=UPI0022E20938|nr:uncharacterized protein LOC128241749 isoform X2 [Mya arenaria]